MSHQNDTVQADKRSLWTKDFIFIALINLATFVGYNMTTTGMPFYVKTLGAGDGIVGLVTTLTTIAALLVRPLSGLLLDRFGRKGILLLGIGGMIVVTGAYAVFPMLGVILVLRFLHGIAWGLGSTATSTIVADVIPRQRFAEGMGYFALMSAVAVAIAPALSIGIVQNSGVFPMIMIAVVSTIVAFVIAILQHSDKIKENQPQGKVSLTTLFEKQAALPALLIFLLNGAFGAVVTFIALFGQSRGVQNIWVYFTVYAVVTLMVRPITGRLIDKKGFFWPGVVSTLGVVLTLILIACSDNLMMFCVAGVFAGIGLGTGMGTLQTMAVSAVAPARRGVATATFLFGLDAGVGIGAAVAGVIAGFIGYSGMYLVMAVFPAAAFVLFITRGKKWIDRYSKQ